MMHSSFALVLLLFSGCCSSAQKNNLHFSYITTITGGIRAIGGKPVIDLALEEINNRNDILQNYTLNYTVIRNSEVCVEYYKSVICCTESFVQYTV